MNDNRTRYHHLMRVAAVLLSLFACLPIAPAQRPAAPPDRQPTWLHGAILDRSSVIVHAHLGKDEILPLHDIQITTFDVKETLKGKPRTEVMIGGMGVRGSAFKDLDKVLFLKPLRSGRIFELIDVVDLTAKEETVVVETLRAYLRLSTTGNPITWDRSLFALSLRNLETRSVFGTRVAVHELTRLCRAAPFLFKSKHLDILRTAAKTMPPASMQIHDRLIGEVSLLLGSHLDDVEGEISDPVARREFKRAVEVFRRTRADDERIRRLEQLTEAAGRSSRRFLEAVLLDPSSGVRQRAAWFLGEIADAASTGPLLRGLLDSHAKERLMRIEALGKLGQPRSVTALIPELDHRETIDAALLAMARIGGVEAEAILDRVERALEGVSGEEERTGRIRYYRSPAFAKAEGKRRLQARKAWP